jgi:putative ABC transport system permease protein
VLYRSVPLAWKNLTHDLRKLAVAVAGVCFAVALMFQQRGFNNALFDSSVELIEQMDADIVIRSEARFALSSELRFNRNVLDLARSCPGVAAASPIYLENSLAHLRRAGFRARPIRVIAFDLDQNLLKDPQGDLGSAKELLKRPYVAIMDRLSKRNYGFELDRNAPRIQNGELVGQRLSIVGMFTLGRDFAHDGNLIMSVENLANYFPYRALDPTSVVDLGLIKCEPGSDIQQVQRELTLRLPRGVVVLPRQQYINEEVAFWAKSTPIGMIFAIGSVMGFVVGVIICYQVLANDIVDHLREFATLKAMGYSNFYFFRLVLAQSIFLSTLGFIPGLLLTFLLFQVNSAFTGLTMLMTWDRALFVLALTLLMCVLSGLLALRKLLSADPASLF